MNMEDERDQNKERQDETNKRNMHEGRGQYEDKHDEYGRRKR